MLSTSKRQAAFYQRYSLLPSLPVETWAVHVRAFMLSGTSTYARMNTQNLTEALAG